MKASTGRTSPAAVEVERASIAWLRSFGVGETRREAATLAGGRFAWLAARAYPRVPTARLRVVADFDGLRAWIAALPAWSYASERYE